MTQMYYRTPDGEPTSNLPSLIPHVINPQALTDAELADYNVARCTVVHPAVEWWQQRGARQIDTAQTPHVITWVVETRTLEDVRALAWQRITALSFAARVEADAFGARVSAPAFPARNDT